MEQAPLQDSAEDGQVEFNDRGMENPHIGRVSLQGSAENGPVEIYIRERGPQEEVVMSSVWDSSQLVVVEEALDDD
jgi:hypothetical protein